jgi:uncharacterized protein (TIRG00374 family)
VRRLSGAPVRLLLGLGISGLLAYLLLGRLDRASLGTAIASADPRPLLPAVALYFVAVWVRSVRWRLLLPRGRVSGLALFRALILGFTVNNLLPLRMGEVVRAYLLNRWCGVRYGPAIASLLVERVLDGLALAVILLAALPFVPAPGDLVQVGRLVGALFCVAAAVLALIAWRTNEVRALAGWLARPLPARVGALADRLVTGFAAGLGLVRGWRRLGSLFILSLLAWAFELSLYYLVMLGFPLPASFALALVAGAAANFATLVPSSPGYIGTFETALVGVLQQVPGVAPVVATAYALVVHAAVLVPVVLAGAVVLWLSGLSLAQLTAVAEHSRAASSQAGNTSPTAA